VCQGLVADALGRGDREKARELSKALLQWGLAIGGILAGVYAGFELWESNALPRFFTEDQGIIDKVDGPCQPVTWCELPSPLCGDPHLIQVVPIVWLLAIMQPLNGFVNVGAGVLQGAQDFGYQVRPWVGCLSWPNHLPPLTDPHR
jgi:Na+-driven multidrug efflux pump